MTVALLTVQKCPSSGLGGVYLRTSVGQLVSLTPTSSVTAFTGAALVGVVVIAWDPN